MNDSSALRLVKKSFAPKYVGLAQSLLRQMARDGLSVGDRLGTEIELSQRHGVSRVTVRQALSMLEKEGYISRRKARGTFVARSMSGLQRLSMVRGSVLVVCSNEQAANMDDDFGFATVLRRLERTLARQGFSVTLLGIGEDRTADKARLEHLTKSDELQGICTIGPCLEPFAESFGAVPVVTSCCFHSERLPLVRQDVTQVVFECVSHLLQNGHRDVAMVCGAWINQSAFALFVEGYRRAHEAAGVRFRRHLLYHAYRDEELKTLVDAVLSSEAPPTAIFAENWQVCQAILDVIKQRGLNIPDDLSLVAYGQNVLRLQAPLGITTYVPDSERIGQVVAELLTALVDGGPVPVEPVNVSGQLIVRESVRRLPAASG